MFARGKQRAEAQTCQLTRMLRCVCGAGHPHQVEELPEGPFLATSDELPGLVAQGRTVAETLETAREVARRLIESRRDRGAAPQLPTTTDRRNYPIVLAA